MTADVQENYKMKDNYLRLNNVIFPVWFLILFPVAWLVILPANFIIDTIVLVAALKSLKLPVKDQYKRSILWVWIMGFVADLAGSALLLVSQMITGSGEAVRWFRLNDAGPAAANPFETIWRFLLVFLAVAIAGAGIYLLNYNVSFRKLDITMDQKKKLAVILAVFTSPYVFFIPSALFW